MRVLTIFARCGTAKYATAEEELALLFRRQLPGVSRDVVVVDTALRPSEVERHADRVVIGSDNSAREFSAFDSGLAFVGHDLQGYDLVNLTTSAFRQLYTDYLERFTPAVLAAAAVRPVCVGHIDCYNEPISVHGCVSQHWMRTSCLFLAPTELQILGSLVSERDPSAFFSGDPSAPFRADAPLSPTYQRLISDWLSGKDIGQGATWHSYLEPNRENLAEFEGKAMSLLNEHLFALRLRAAGCHTIDVTWLSAQLAARRPSEVDWRTPWWRQLAERDRHAVRVGQASLLAS
jgi:hypothetical protein